MPKKSLKIKSRSTLWIILGVGLLLIHARDFLPLIATRRMASGLVGTVILIVFAWNLIDGFSQPEPGSTNTAISPWIMAALSISGASFLFVSRLIHSKPWARSLSDMVGFFLLGVCWSYPKSRWQEFAYVGFLGFALSEVRWKELAIFGRHIYVIIALLTLWLAVSALAFLFLVRRKPSSHAPSGLN